MLKNIFLLLIIFPLSIKAADQIVKARLQEFALAYDALPASQRNEYVIYKNKAYRARSSDKYFTALISISHAQEIFQNDLDLLFLKGYCLAQVHDVNGAIKNYEKVLKIDPSHMITLLNMVEINFHTGNHQESLKFIKRINSLLDKQPIDLNLPLLDFKHLICLTKLSEKRPLEFRAQIAKLKSKYTFMDDNPFYYYANALVAFNTNNKEERFQWVVKAYTIFQQPKLIKKWNKALIDAGYINAYEIMFHTQN